MDALELIGEMRRRGVILKAEGQHLRYYPSRKVTPELRSALKRHKGKTLMYLAGLLREDELSLTPPSTSCYACCGAHFWCTDGGPWICSRCHPPAVPEAEIERVSIGADTQGDDDEKAE